MGPYVQSERMGMFKQYAEQLVAEGKAYYCFCTEERLNDLHEQQKANGEKSHYDGNCRDQPQEEINDKNVVYDEAAYRRSKPVDKLPLQDKIVLDDIVYKYPNSDVLIFDHAHMEIPAGKSVGIEGTSGAGKTTIVDIMLGLLSITEVHILADGVEIRVHY